MEFSFARIWLLIKKQIAENRQLYFFSMLIIAGVMFIVCLVPLTDRGGLSARMQGDVFLAGLIAAGAVFTSSLFNQFSEKIKGAQNLALPASALEKLTAAIIFSILLFPLCYTIFVYPVLCFAHFIDLNIGNLNTLYVFDYATELQYMFTFFLVLQPLVLLCSLMFKKYTTIKTAVLLGIIWFVLIFIGPILVKSFVINEPVKTIRIRNMHYAPNGQLTKTIDRSQPNNTVFLYTMAFNDIRFTTNGYFDEVLWVKLPEKQSFLFQCLLFISIPFIYIIAWFKIREIQL